MIIDPKSPVPIFQQVASQLRQQIVSGVYRPNESLPSLRSLAAEILVNPNTVQRAYDELSREGLVESRRGSGLFVVDQADAVAAGQTEKQLRRELTQAIANGLRAAIAPQRLRTLFREALESQVAASIRRAK
jgi:GntR family transcriptional regulator